MKQEDFEVEKTESGKRIIKMKKDEFTKNHRANDTTKESDSIISETSSEACPYKVFTFYISKMNRRNPFLWQKCRDKIFSDDVSWFENRKIGLNYIKNICDIDLWILVLSLYTFSSSLCMYNSSEKKNILKMI